MGTIQTRELLYNGRNLGQTRRGGGGMIPQPPRALSGKVHEGYDHGLGDFRVFPDPCMSYCLQLEMNYFSVHCMINERKMTKMCGLFFF